MYSAYKLKLENGYHEDYYEIGLSQFDANKAKVVQKIDSFALNNGILDGAAIEKNWFPSIPADIFISHSHMDAEEAIKFSGVMKKHFGLNSFIDSCIWGYADDLLQIIDDRHCRNDDRKTYNYSKRNRSTSHVHTMLSIALMKMIDKTECLIFLDTPNSTNTDGVIQKTYSPWIYAEIAMAKVVQRKPKEKHRKGFLKSRLVEDASMENFSFVEYVLDTICLKSISKTDISNWAKQYTGKNHPLDVLYDIAPIELEE